MVYMGTRLAVVKNVFSTPRNAALIENKMLQYTTFSTNFNYRTLCEPETHILTLSFVLVCLSIHCAEQQQFSNRDFITKSVGITLQRSVNIAIECQQA